MTVKHLYDHAPAHRKLGIDAVRIFDKIREAEGHKVRQTSRRGEVIVTMTPHGWRIEGRGAVTHYRPEVDGTMRVEIIGCTCGIENPTRRQCDELGHVERVTAMAKKILASY